MGAVKKPHRGQFKPGNRLGGRPLGSRNRLTEVALAALGDDFSVHGASVIEQVRTEKPHIYLQVVASLLPKQMHVERTSVLGELSDDQIAQIEELLTGLRAKTVRQLEKINGAAIVHSSDADQPEK